MHHLPHATYHNTVYRQDGQVLVLVATLLE
jgi:hypothetical protein